MIIHTGRRRLSVVFLLLSLIFVLIPSVSADSVGTVQFSVSDAQVQKGRLVSVSVTARSNVPVSAFVTEVEYDTQVLSYRSIRVPERQMQYSVNSDDSSKLMACWTSPNGENLSSEKELMSISFKADVPGSSNLSFKVTQAVSSRGEDIKVLSVSDAVVTVTDSAPKAKAKEKDSAGYDVASYEEVYSESTDEGIAEGFRRIFGGSSATALIVVVVCCTIAVVAAILILMYKSGKLKINKKKSEVLLLMPSDDE